jgi:hypothetical protein
MAAPFGGQSSNGYRLAILAGGRVADHTLGQKRGARRSDRPKQLGMNRLRCAHPTRAALRPKADPTRVIVPNGRLALSPELPTESERLDQVFMNRAVE